MNHGHWIATTETWPLNNDHWAMALPKSFWNTATETWLLNNGSLTIATWPWIHGYWTMVTGSSSLNHDKSAVITEPRLFNHGLWNMVAKPWLLHHSYCTIDTEPWTPNHDGNWSIINKKNHVARANTKVIHAWPQLATKPRRSDIGVNAWIHFHSPFFEELAVAWKSSWVTCEP